MPWKESIRIMATKMYEMSSPIFDEDDAERRELAISNLRSSLERLFVSERAEDKELFNCIDVVVND